LISVTGHIAIDEIMKIKNGRYVESFGLFYGGGAANSSVVASRLEEEVDLYGIVGGDFPKDYLSHLESSGVRAHLKFLSEERTARAWILNFEGRNISYFYWGASKMMEELLEDIPDGKDFLIITGSPEFCIGVSDVSERVFIDPGPDIVLWTKDDFSKVLEKTEVLFLNAEEFKYFLRIYGELPTCELVVTSELGAKVFEEGELIGFAKAVRTRVVDPTGAGDAFRAAYVISRKRGYEPVESAKIGNCVSSFIVEEVGAQTNVPGWREVKKRFLQYYGSPI